MGYVTYGENEIKIIENGIEEIRKVLMGNDTDKKRSLLFALDWFMDSYYKKEKDISNIRDELIELLQIVIVSSNDKNVSEEALQLLEDYECPPFEILEKMWTGDSWRMK